MLPCNVTVYPRISKKCFKKLLIILPQELFFFPSFYWIDYPGREQAWKCSAQSSPASVTMET